MTIAELVDRLGGDAETARLIGSTRQGVWKWRTGGAALSARTLLDLCRLADVDPRDVVVPPLRRKPRQTPAR